MKDHVTIYFLKYDISFFYILDITLSLSNFKNLVQNEISDSALSHGTGLYLTCT